MVVLITKEDMQKYNENYRRAQAEECDLWDQIKKYGSREACVRLMELWN